MPETDKAAEKELQRLRKLPENRVCPNCLKEAGVGFQAVCMQYKTFICSECKSAHQSFSHRCKSTAMSIWTMEEVKVLDGKRGGGNEAARSYYLARLPEGERPTADSDLDKYKRFIERAYIEQRWIGSPHIGGEAGVADSPEAADRKSSERAERKEKKERDRSERRRERKQRKERRDSELSEASRSEATSPEVGHHVSWGAPAYADGGYSFGGFDANNVYVDAPYPPGGFDANSGFADNPYPPGSYAACGGEGAYGCSGGGACGSNASAYSGGYGGEQRYGQNGGASPTQWHASQHQYDATAVAGVPGGGGPDWQQQQMQQHAGDGRQFSPGAFGAAAVPTAPAAPPPLAASRSAVSNPALNNPFLAPPRMIQVARSAPASPSLGLRGTLGWAAQRRGGGGVAAAVGRSAQLSSRSVRSAASAGGSPKIPALDPRTNPWAHDVNSSADGYIVSSPVSLASVSENSASPTAVLSVRTCGVGSVMNPWSQDMARYGDQRFSGVGAAGLRAAS